MPVLAKGMLLPTASPVMRCHLNITYCRLLCPAAGSLEFFSFTTVDVQSLLLFSTSNWREALTAVSRSGFRSAV